MIMRIIRIKSKDIVLYRRSPSMRQLCKSWIAKKAFFVEQLSLKSSKVKKSHGKNKQNTENNRTPLRVQKLVNVSALPCYRAPLNGSGQDQTEWKTMLVLYDENKVLLEKIVSIKHNLHVPLSFF